MTESNSKVIAPAMQSKKTNQRRTTEQFILEAIATHGDRYDYSKTVYINAKTKVLITCKKHGDFYVFVHTHLNGGICRKCSNEITSQTVAGKKEKPTTKRKTTHEIVNEFQLVHGKKYNYSKVFYINNREKVEIVCRKHGSFYQTAKSHKAGRGCPDCGLISRVGKRKKATGEVISCFIKAHGYRYKYHKLNYLGAMKKVCIECVDHGDFWQTPADHQAGHGCPICKTSYNTYKRQDYIDICELKNGMSKLYVIECSEDGERFYKVGITRKPLSERFNGWSMPYKYSVLYLIEGAAGFVWDLETQIHRLLKNYRYTPEVDFGGSKTECFSRIPANILKLISTINSSNQMQLLA